MTDRANFDNLTPNLCTALFDHGDAVYVCEREPGHDGLHHYEDDFSGHYWHIEWSAQCPCCGGRSRPRRTSSTRRIGAAP